MQGGLSSLCRQGMGHGPSSRTTLAVVAAAAATLGAGCIDRESTPAGRDDRDAAVVIRSAVASTEATWSNLWGSWPQGRYSHAMAYDSDRKVMVMYGGQAGAAGPFYNDTWEWDPARTSWTQRANTGPDAGTRSGHAMAYDPGTKKVLMFSGWQPTASFYIAGQWEWDPVGSAWVQRASTGTQPVARHDHAMVYNPDRQRIVMFGGEDATASPRRNDIWEWNGATGTWEDCMPAVPATMMPAPRYGHTLAYDSARQKVVMRGGNTGAGTAVGAWVNETWEWTAGTGAACSSGSWAPVTTTGTAPPYSGNAGFDHIAYDASRSKIVLYEYGPANSVYELDSTTPTWTTVTTTRSDTNNFPSSGFETLVYDPVHANTVIFAGSTYPRSLWVYDGARALFTNQSVPLVGPIQRTGPALAFDSKRGQLILFGGYQGSNPRQDIQQWSGTNQIWNDLTTFATKPDPRQLSAMAYDSKRDLMYLFGGTGATTFADFWAWAPGTMTWSTVAVTPNTTLPTARYGHSLFYDAKRDRVVMFGGAGTEIWEFDPTAALWTKRSPTTIPAQAVPNGVSTRSSADVAYDQDRGKLVYLGGQSYDTSIPGYTFNTDIWEWDAASGTWGQLIPAASSPIPTGRVLHTIVYDSGRRVIVMFGGHGSDNIQRNDSWEWDASSLGWTNTTPTLGIAPLPRDNPTMVYNSTDGSTFLFGGNVTADTTYGAQEIWTYAPNNAPRPNGSPCSTATASHCASGNCVDGVCCAASSCPTTCQACNVPGTATLGVCSYVSAGTADDSCSSGQACDVNHQCKASQGQSCGTFSDCATGHCADGACCDTDCTDSCKACNLTGKVGTCSNIPSGREDPIAAPTCVSDATQPRYCDGNGVCTNAPKPIGSACTASGQCAPPAGASTGFCIDGVCCNQACNLTCYTCNNGTTPGTCSVLAAGLQDHSATTTCDAANQYCVGGSCQSNKKPNGQTCNTSTDCGSGYCVDNICCNSSCQGICQGCNVPGKLGSCVNLPVGSTDNSPTALCPLPQYCDAAGTCQSGLKATGLACTTGSQCATGNCVDGFCCNSACADTCYACNNPNNEGTCGPIPPGGTDGMLCMPSNYCTNGACSMGKKPNGASCGLGNECGSNYCIDGTCCENACLGSKCLTCKNATGSCTYAAAGTDLRKDCGSGDCAGTCDGAGSCAFPPQGKSCGMAGCLGDGVIHQVGMCDGAGNCGNDISKKCDGGFVCYHDMTDNTDKCRTSCDNDPDCRLAFYCDMPTQQCPPSLANGQVCKRDAQCISNHCAIVPGASSGLCCDRDCHACGSCNLPGKEGTCVPALAGTDPNHDCIDSASDPSGVCGGKCDGQWACQFPAMGTSCGLCKVCDGAAKCNVMPEDDTACGVIDCDGLDTSCSDYHDLQSKRCATVGACKAANSPAACPTFTNLCMPDAGSGAGGSSGAGGATGSTDAGTDAGGADAATPPKKGGGGCGCDVGSASSGASASWLGMTLAGALVLARRRRGRRR